MGGSVERHQQARRQADAYLARAMVSTTVLEQRAREWRCELRCAQHPGGPDMPLDVVATGETRGGALDAAHATLRSEVTRYYLDVAAGDAELNGVRETMAYEPGLPSARRVVTALAFRRQGDVSIDTAMAAGLHVKVTSGGNATVGDVVAHLLDRDQLLLSA